LKRLWAPWRMKYILGDRPGSGCVFCDALAAGDDAAHYIVRRGQHAFVILNTFPYTNGHMMVVPYTHTGTLEGLDDATLLETMQLVQHCLRALRQVFAPQGFNIGLNLGRAAGAGVIDHFHMHVVPRWTGDSNFMPICGRTKIVLEDLETTYARLAPLFRRERRNTPSKS